MATDTAELKLAFNEWEEKYKPIRNPRIPVGHAFDGSWALYLHDSAIDRDKEEIRKANPSCVWTYIDGDSIGLLSPGIHRANAIGYLITEVPVAAEDAYTEVVLFDEGEDED